jgi:hypothetical protein
MKFTTEPQRLTLRRMPGVANIIIHGLDEEHHERFYRLL